MDLPPTFYQDITGQSCCAFIGAGLSIPAGYKSWIDMIDELGKIAKSQPGYLDKIEELNYWEKADKYREILGENQYQGIIFPLICPDGKEVYRRIHEVLMLLPFQSFITTNYDFCLERAAQFIGKHPITRYFPELNPSHLHSKDVFHIHGIPFLNNEKNPLGTIIFSERDYRFAYEEDHHLTSFLIQLFQFNSIVFMGFSLKDEYLIRTIKKSLSELRHRQEYEFSKDMGFRKEFRNYIFLHQDDVSNEIINELKLIPILYGGEKYFHTELQKILEEIGKKTQFIAPYEISLDQLFT
jgi:hypothetical protein